MAKCAITNEHWKRFSWNKAIQWKDGIAKERDKVVDKQLQKENVLQKS